MGRKPIGGHAMTAAERQQRRRDKYQAAIAKDFPHGTERRFRLELYRLVMDLWKPQYSELDAKLVRGILDQLGRAIMMEQFLLENEEKYPGEQGAWDTDFLYMVGLCDPDRNKNS